MDLLTGKVSHLLLHTQHPIIDTKLYLFADFMSRACKKFVHVLNLIVALFDLRFQFPGRLCHPRVSSAAGVNRTPFNTLHPVEDVTSARWDGKRGTVVIGSLGKHAERLGQRLKLNNEGIERTD